MARHHRTRPQRAATICLLLLLGACAFDAAPEATTPSDASDVGAPDAPEDIGGELGPVVEPDAIDMDISEDEPEGCAEGQQPFFVDGDLDGVGGEDSGECGAEPVEGLSFESGDCDDTNANIWRVVELFTDLDGDSFTGAAIPTCIGESPPPGLTDVASRPPEEALGPGLVTFLQDGIEWEDPENLRIPDSDRARCKLDEDEPCADLFLSRFGLQIPPEATVLGIEVTIVGRVRREEASLGESIELMVDGAVVGEVRGNEEPWSRNREVERHYGGAGDLWGAALTPEQLSRPGFGVKVVVPGLGNTKTDVDLDHVSVRVYHDKAIDCADDDSNIWSPGSGFVDGDGDGFGGVMSARFCTGNIRAEGVAPVPDDCFDANSRAYPGSNTSLGEHRGDGSFDYNCDGAEVPASLFTDTGCNFNPISMSCTSNRQSVDMLAACGEDNAIARCSGANEGCDLQPESTPTRCQ